MAKKPAGFALVAVGVLLIIVCLAADSIGLGPNPGIGWKQITGAVVGLVLAIVGMPMLKSGD